MPPWYGVISRTYLVKEQEYYVLEPLAFAFYDKISISAEQENPVVEVWEKGSCVFERVGYEKSGEDEFYFQGLIDLNIWKVFDFKGRRVSTNEIFIRPISPIFQKCISYLYEVEACECYAEKMEALYKEVEDTISINIE